MVYIRIILSVFVFSFIGYADAMERELTVIQKREDALFKAIKEGNSKRVSFIMSRNNIDLKKEHPRHGFPLLCAAAEGQDRIVGIICKRADALGQKSVVVNQKDRKTGWTLLHCAVDNAGFRAADVYMIESILNHGVNIDEQNFNGQTPLHLAAEAGKLYIVKYLISRGIDHTIVDEYGETALVYAKGALEYNSKQQLSQSFIECVLGNENLLRKIVLNPVTENNLLVCLRQREIAPKYIYNK